MEFSLPKETLSKALETVKGVVAKRNTIPILSNVKIEAAPDFITLTTTDLDREVSLKIPVDGDVSVRMPGATTAQVELLSAFVKKLQSGVLVGLKLPPVVDDDVEPQMHVSGGRVRVKFNVMSPSDFPSFAHDVTDFYPVFAADLLKIFKQGGYAVSTEDTRYYLNGLFLHNSGDNLRGVSTDGHRLVMVDAGAAINGMPGVIVPRYAMEVFSKALAACGDDETVLLRVSQSRIELMVGNLTIKSKVIDGDFPDYQRVLPKAANKVVVVKTDELKKAVERVSTISLDKAKSVKFEVKGETIGMSVKNIEGSMAYCEIDIVSSEELPEEGVTIGFNAGYVVKALSNITGEEIEIRFTDAAAPTPVYDATDPGVLHILMPLRV